MRLALAVACSACILCAQKTQPDPGVQKMLREISAERFAASVKTLAGFVTRGNFSDPNQKTRGIGAARRWLADQFKSYSPRLEVTFDTTKKGETEIVSVIATLPGATQPRKQILVTAHYDSINLKVKGPAAAEAPAPGADDDASGTAAVLELARVMSQYRFEKTLVFVAFAGEELGLVGSTAFAARAKAAGRQIEAVFNNDIIGSNVVGITHDSILGNDDVADDSDGDTGNRLRIYSPDPAVSPSRRLALLTRDAAGLYVPKINIDMMNRADRFDRGGDHLPFQANGYAAVRLTTASEHSVTQHTAGDLPEGISPPFAADVTRINCAAMATLAIPVR